MPRARSASTSSETARTSRTGSRHVTHVSRACDGCRRRKMRCDGTRPQCGACKDRSSACEYKDEDKRKTHTEQMDDIKSRMDRFENLIQNLIDVIPSRPAPVQQVIPMQVDPVPSTPIQTLPIAIPNHQPRQDTVLYTMTNPSLPFTSSSTEPLNPVIPPETSPITETSLLTVAGASSDPERFSRVEDAGGSLLHFGPTSLWTYKAPRRSVMSQSPNEQPVRSGEWVDWSRHLPPSLNIDRATHDKALEYFSAFYAPWLLIVDMPAFKADMLQSDASRGPQNTDSTGLARTAHYSPLLHCCILYVGLHLIREEEPELIRRFDAAFVQHCYPLLLLESDQPTLSSLRGLHMFAAAVHFYRMATHSRGPESWERPYSTGYLHSGMPIAAVNVMGLNVDCSSYVARGHITEQERDSRDYGFWTTFLLDTIRGVAGGRAPMVAAAQVPFPRINKGMDDTPWTAPRLAPAARSPCPGLIMSGTPSMVSTTFHWTARLAVIAHALVTQSYSSTTGDSNRETFAANISQQLDEWYANFPLRPAEKHALPHILMLHCTYHLCVILVHRPFYRASRPVSEGRCDQSAMAILSLVRLFDSTYGFRFGHHNHINALFGAATVFLLKCVGSLYNSDSWRMEVDNFNQCLELFARLGTVWQEARMAREVLVGLHDEYNPTSAASNLNTTSLSNVDHSKELQDWLASQDAWGMFFPDQAINWDQSGISF